MDGVHDSALPIAVSNAGGLGALPSGPARLPFNDEMTDPGFSRPGRVTVRVGDVTEQPVAQNHQELDRTLLVR